MSISTVVKTIQDIMRKDSGVDGDAQRINQLVWMFFLKIFDDRESEKELLEDNYRSPMPERLRWRNWAADAEGITGEGLADFINNDLFKTLKELSSPDPRAQLVRHVFEEANNYMKSGTLMRQVINKINEVDFNRKDDLHLFGDIYEQILRDLQAAGNAGEFYTPRAVTKFMVQMVNPTLGERVLDPACGTGGFLTNAIEHVRKEYVHNIEDEQILQESIKGIEKKQLPYFLCVTNMMLHGIDTPNQIAHDNTLSRPYRDYQPEDRVDVIITNPPFGGMEEDGIEKNFPSTYSTRETADLFLVLITHLLREGGRGAIVLPDGTLFGEGVKTRIKEKLLTECNLHTIVRLPNGVFSPYTGIKTNLLFFTKGEPTKEVWYYEHPYPAGAKSYNKTKPIRIEEFDAEKAWWAERVESERSWRVPFETIAANNFNLDIKNPNSPDEVHGDFEELLAAHNQILADLSATRDTLKNELLNALRATTGDITLSLQTFFDNFPLLADSPNGVAKSRELVLQLAVEGRLVSQSSDDEPVAILLQRVKANKDELAAEGRISKPEIHELIRENEKPFLLPRNWEWVRFSQVTNEVHYGYTASADHTLLGVRLLRITDIQNGRVDWAKVPGCEIEEKKLDSVKLTNNDLLIARTGGTIGKSYIVEDLDLVAVFASYLIRAIPNENLFPRYLKTFLESEFYWAQLRAKSMGTGQPNVNATSLKSLVISLPPFEEQKRIVTKVDELMHLCDGLEAKQQAKRESRVRLNNAALAPLNNTATFEPNELDLAITRLADNFDDLYDSVETVGKLRSTIFRLAVQGKLVSQDPNEEPADILLSCIKQKRGRLLEDGYPNVNEANTQRRKQQEQSLPKGLQSLPFGWRWATLMQCAILVIDCHNKTAPYSKGGIILLRTTNIRDGKLNLRQPKFVGEQTYERWSARCQPEPGDILITREAPMGEVCIIPDGMKICLGQRIMLARVIPGTIDPEYMLCSLRDPNLMERVQDKPVGSTVEHLRVRGVETLLIPVPPLGEQKRIVVKVNQLIESCNELETKLRKFAYESDRLMTSGIHELLTSARVASEVRLLDTVGV